MTTDRNRIIVAEVIAKAWQDSEARAALLADPTTVLREAGVDLRKDQKVTVLEDTSSVRHVVVPDDPSEQVVQQVLSVIAASLPLPEGMQLVLRQSSDRERFIVMPQPLAADGSLSEQDLGLVVGGNAGNGGNGGAGGLTGGGSSGGAGGVVDWLGTTGGNGGNGGIGWIG